MENEEKLLKASQKYQRLIDKCISKYTSNFNYSELYNVCLEAIWKAIIYNHNKIPSLSLAATIIRRELLRYARKNKKKIIKVNEIIKFIKSNDPYVEAETDDLIDFIKQHIDNLEYTLLIKKYEGYSYKEIADECKLLHEYSYVAVINFRTLKKLRRIFNVSNSRRKIKQSD